MFVFWFCTTLPPSSHYWSILFLSVQQYIFHFCFYRLFSDSVLKLSSSSSRWTVVAVEMCPGLFGSTAWNRAVRLDNRVRRCLPAPFQNHMQIRPLQAHTKDELQRKISPKVRRVSLLDMLNIITSFWHFPRGENHLLCPCTAECSGLAAAFTIDSRHLYFMISSFIVWKSLTDSHLKGQGCETRSLIEQDFWDHLSTVHATG